jgi:hypothetical protein
MRLASVTFLLFSSVALSACGGGGGGDSLNLDAGTDVCGLSCPVTKPTKPTKPPTPPPTAGGLPPVSTTNTGNTTKLTTGDVTIALESGVLIQQDTAYGLSKLTVPTFGLMEGQSAKIEIDTKTKRNSSWPKPKNLVWYEFGTNNITPTPNSKPDTKIFGGGTYNEYRALTDASPEGTPADEKQDAADESLQVWTFKNSYAAQYRNLGDGTGKARHQTWSFGGNPGKSASSAADMPSAGSVTFKGEYVSNAETKNYKEREGADLNVNQLWSTKGNSEVSINFASKNVTGKLSPKIWRGVGKDGFENVWVDDAKTEFAARVELAQAQAAAGQEIDLPPISYNLMNYYAYMDDQINIKGVLTTPATGGNLISGSVVYDPATTPQFTSDSANPFFASVFGSQATGMEVTGAFALKSIEPQPIGGNTAINDDRRGYVSHSGVIHATQQ